jgi:mono/diheme cytochrome c family protein
MRLSKRLPMACLLGTLLIATDLGSHDALAADADKGKQIAQSRCAPCHIVVPGQRQELANSPPFDEIAKRHEVDAGMLAFSILSPHPRMNMTISREEAEDLAAYIVSLRK